MEIKQLPKTPTLPADTADGGKSLVRALWDHIIQSNETVNRLIKQVLGLKPGDIGALSDTTTAKDIGAAAAVQEAWKTPTLLNGWQNYGNGYNNAGYYKDSLGVVHLRGLVKGGSSIGSYTVSDYILVLPVGYRPLGGIYIFRVLSNNALGRCDIVSADGGVAARVGNNGWFCLDGISFRAEA
ncbi:hypothetical protein M7775_17060 [Sporomusa sphaeroides DSM 2875]|uniref:hypothetical protein n=1 Tax=Sporomusa sphaeroides TaxID=47679 RepID=UPI00202E6568|nr:hypothetical protein [Sporomusa sphaeroides]MCM0760265.1 hypothetical protein [Sporomusa sphaeroides DSM 2875]